MKTGNEKQTEMKPNGEPITQEDNSWAKPFRKEFESIEPDKVKYSKLRAIYQKTKRLLLEQLDRELTEAEELYLENRYCDLHEAGIYIPGDMTFPALDEQEEFSLLDEATRMVEEADAA